MYAVCAGLIEDLHSRTLADKVREGFEVVVDVWG